jgi:hypothetical protein
MPSSAGSSSSRNALGTSSRLGVRRSLTRVGREPCQERQQRQSLHPARGMSHHAWLRQARRLQTTALKLEKDSHWNTHAKHMVLLGGNGVISLVRPHHRGVAGGVAGGEEVFAGTTRSRDGVVTARGGLVVGACSGRSGTITCYTCQQQDTAVRVRLCLWAATQYASV